VAAGCLVIIVKIKGEKTADTGNEPGGSGVRRSPFSLGGVEFTVVSEPAEAPDALTKLTGAEREVALAALRGLSNEEIARARGTSKRTVANQLAALYRKLGVGSRAELAALAASGRRVQER
jgi:DNA-binding NarL/FixJ family response regulator